MKGPQLSQVLKDLTSDLHKEGEEIDKLEGGFGMIDEEEFSIAIIAALGAIFKDSKAWKFSGTTLNDQGEEDSMWGGARDPEEEKFFAIEIAGNLYGPWGETSEKSIAQDMIDTFMVGCGSDDGAPLPNGWSLKLSKEPFNPHLFSFYQDVFEDFKKRFSEVWSDMEHAHLQDEVKTVSPKRSHPRL